MRPLLFPILALAACGPAGEPANVSGPDQPGWNGPPQAPATGRLDRSHAGETAPATAFEDSEGAPASLADFAGKPVLLNLWATWCAPCVAEMPTLDALAAREKDIQVVALSQDLEGRQKVDAFFEKGKFTALEAYLDPELRLMGALKVQSLPTTILYDARGREVWRMTGAEDWQGERVAALLAEAKL